MAGRGSAPGERRGGRVKGKANRVTEERLERERIARQAQTEVDKAYHAKVKLGKDVLEDYMMAFHGIAAHYQNQLANAVAGGKPPAAADLAAFKEWGTLVATTAKNLAEFQSPKFKAIAVMAPPPNPNQAPPKQIDGKVIPLNDPVAIARVYQNMVRQVR